MSRIYKTDFWRKMSLFDIKKILPGLFLSAMFFAACSEDSTEPEYTLYPDNDIFYSLAPNDMAANDSISANLAHGVKLVVHPNASYELSFEKDASVSDVPELQIFHLSLNSDSTAYYATKIMALQPKEVNGRYVYSFVCEEKTNAFWATSLAVDDHFYPGTTKDVKFTGDGAYSDHFSLNMIVVGKHDLTSDGVDVEELAQKTLDSFRKYYTSVTIDTIYIRYAHEHPTLGPKYPANEPWLAGADSSMDMFLYELGGWPEKDVYDALDIVYVYRIEIDKTVGYASLFSANLGGGAYSTVLVGNYVLAKDSPQKEFLLSSDEIVETVLHETGHFFGLRHTTSTMNDFLSSQDYSIIEDGLEDTPYCEALLRNGLMKRPSVKYSLSTLPVMPGHAYRRTWWKNEEQDLLSSCPDSHNFMFPATQDETFEGFSEQQLEIIRKNLMLFPHGKK